MSDQEHESGHVTIERKDTDSGEKSRTSSLDEFKASVREFAQKIPDSIGRAIESISARVNAITIHVDDEAQRRIDSLVEAGIFKNRSDSAAYLVNEGIRARATVFAAIDARVAEIDRLRKELRALVAEPGEEG